jgi:octopine/nopaline transport system permease protein
LTLPDLFGFGAAGWGSQLLLALGMTLAVTLAAMAIGAVLGAGVAAAKLARGRAFRVAGDAYTTLFRGVPELLIIYFIYFGGSNALTAIGALLGGQGFLGMPAFVAGALAVGVISGAYQAEVYRGAFLSLGRGQIEAASAIGMARAMRFRRIVAPQILRAALPGLGNVWQLSLKDSALVSVTGLAELMRTSQIGARSTHHYFAFYIVGGGLYLLVTSLSGGVFGSMERRVAKSAHAGGALRAIRQG